MTKRQNPPSRGLLLHELGESLAILAKRDPCRWLDQVIVHTLVKILEYQFLEKIHVFLKLNMKSKHPQLRGELHAVDMAINVWFLYTLWDLFEKLYLTSSYFCGWFIYSEKSHLPEPFCKTTSLHGLEDIFGLILKVM